MPRTMEKMIAYCGIDCLECGAYIATKNNDDKLRKETAEQWSKKLDFEFNWENLNCDGGCWLSFFNVVGRTYY